jgi:hypothetical protein
MSEPFDPLRQCRTCRFSEAKPDDLGEPWLYCRVMQRACRHACPAYEREPGTEGDRD